MAVNLITLQDPRAAAAEAYRALRTNLMYSSADRPITTLMLTSAAAGEDKSIALANLAVTFAQAGHRTIIVDADLRRPAQHTIWGVDNARGLTTMILEDSLLANPPLIQTDVPNLSVLTSGTLPAVPADILGGARMSQAIGVLKARASYVLFDAPPVLVATDAVVLGVKVDGVVLVTRAGSTRRDQIARAREALERVGARILGAVLTNAPREMKGY
ncbi:MAG: CpsD/CapB family tyrosine-protein kinase [Chloroflexota bacterium]|nr:CpsD/CapB family tyrosine-protein kinase [Chloroflexota bacterium]